MAQPLQGYEFASTGKRKMLHHRRILYYLRRIGPRLTLRSCGYVPTLTAMACD